MDMLLAHGRISKGLYWKTGWKGDLCFVKVINNFKSPTLPLPSLPRSHPAAPPPLAIPERQDFLLALPKPKPKAPAARSQEEVGRDVLSIIPWQGLMSFWSEPQQDFWSQILST